MDEKRLAVLATLKEDGIVNFGIENDSLEKDELVQLGMGAIAGIANEVTDKLQTMEEKEKFYKVLIDRFTTSRDKLK